MMRRLSLLLGMSGVLFLALTIESAQADVCGTWILSKSAPISRKVQEWVAGQPSIRKASPNKPQAKNLKWISRLKYSVPPRTAPEIGFAMDILDLKDWKSLREKVEYTEFSQLPPDADPKKN